VVDGVDGWMFCGWGCIAAVRSVSVKFVAFGVCGCLWRFVAVCGFLWPFVAFCGNRMRWELGCSGNLEKNKKSFAILGEYRGTRKRRKFRFVAVVVLASHLSLSTIPCFCQHHRPQCLEDNNLWIESQTKPLTFNLPYWGTPPVFRW
jgi:hypothetical protein